MAASLAVIMRRFSFVRETDGPNRGAWVQFFQNFCGGAPGDSWCADLESVGEYIAYNGHPVTPRTGSVQAKLDYCRAHGLIVETPQVDDLCFSVDASGHGHHIAIVTAAVPLTVIAGNTSESGLSSDGTGVFEHPVSVAGKVFARLPV